MHYAIYKHEMEYKKHQQQMSNTFLAIDYKQHNTSSM